MNQDVLEGRWKQLHGLAKVKWGKLTDDDLDQTKGNYEILVGKIQEKYGTTREEIERELAKQFPDKFQWGLRYVLALSWFLRQR